MKLVFIYGLPATGKLTVAKELAAMTGFKLFHNHLTVDLLLSVFEFGSAPFVALREEIWLSVFEQARRSGLPGLIFTFVPERTVRAEFIRKTIDGGDVFFVELVCPAEELKRRMSDPSRSRHQKLGSFDVFERLRADGVFDVEYMPSPALTIDAGEYTPGEAAERIRERLRSN
jgi:hypothetical protein